MHIATPKFEILCSAGRYIDLQWWPVWQVRILSQMTYLTLTRRISLEIQFCRCSPPDFLPFQTAFDPCLPDLRGFNFILSIPQYDYPNSSSLKILWGNLSDAVSLVSIRTCPMTFRDQVDADTTTSSAIISPRKPHIIGAL
jgi:hypothetical protein